MVRIVGGRSRGLQIRVPKDAPTRPTTDRVREALFNVLAHRFDDVCRNARVLDLFAGSGALGLEAMSRGAEYVQFVDSDRAAVQQIEANARHIGGQFSVQHQTADRYLKGQPTAFQLVFLDPPYHENLLEPALVSLALSGCLSQDSIVCIECAQTRHFEIPNTYTKRFERRYGKTTIIILAYDTEVQP